MGRQRGEPILSIMEQRFIAHYIVDLNKANAAIAAGYSAHSAKQQATLMLARPRVKRALEDFQAGLASALEVTPKRVLGELARIAFANMDDYVVVQRDGSAYVDLSKCTRAQLAALSEITVDEYVEGKGAEARPVKRVKIKFHSKTQALEDLSKHLGLFEADNSQREVMVRITNYVNAESTGFNSDGSKRATSAPQLLPA